KYATEDFYHYLQIERGLSDNTITAYRRDIDKYCIFIMKEIKKKDWKFVTRLDIVSFLRQLKEEGKSSATIRRTTSSLRMFHRFLYREEIVEIDVSQHIEIPKKERKLPNILSTEEVEALLNIKQDTPLHIRNKAML